MNFFKLHFSLRNVAILLLPVLLFLLYSRCSPFSSVMQVDSYELQDEEDRTLLTVKGQGFSQLGETKILINEQELGQGHLLRWNEREIQMFIRKPFTYALIQIKRGRQTSRIIPVWNAQNLPQLRYTPSHHNFPILAQANLLASQPPILEIQGQNLGFRYAGQFLLLGRQQDTPAHFRPENLSQYRIIQPEEILFWSDKNIRILVPQETTAGVIVLIRQKEARSKPTTSLATSNTLYIPAAPNRNSQQQTAVIPTYSMRLSLSYPKYIFPDSYLLSQNILLSKRADEAIKPQEEAGYIRVRKALAAISLEEMDFPKLLYLSWPRNERNQFWNNAKAFIADKNEVTSKLILPASSVILGRPSASRIKKMGLKSGNLLLQATSNQTESLYLDFSYQSWRQSPPSAVRGQNYSKRELRQWQYLQMQNYAWSQAEEVPYWNFIDRLRSNLSPYWQALELYKQMVREFRLDEPASYAKFLPEQIQDWPEAYRDNTGNYHSVREKPKVLTPEQSLLLYLRAATELEIPTRIIAGSYSTFLQETGEEILYQEELSPYYWLEIYLPNFGWFQFDLLAEMLAYQSDPGDWNRRDLPRYWGLLTPVEPLEVGSEGYAGSVFLEVKLAFFTLQDSWQRFDDGLRKVAALETPKSKRLLPQNNSLESLELTWHLQVKIAGQTILPARSQATGKVSPAASSPFLKDSENSERTSPSGPGDRSD